MEREKLYCTKSPDGVLDELSISFSETEAWSRCMGCFIELDGGERWNELHKNFVGDGWTVVEVEVIEKS